MLGLAHAIGEKGPSWVESALRIGVGLTACTILLMAIATSFSGCARLAEAMGRHTQLPPVFGRTSRRVLAPPAAIISVSVLAIGFLVVGSFFSDEETLTLASLYSFGILIAFMLTQAAIIWLRISEPDLPRPFMMKGNVWIGRRLIPVDLGRRRRARRSPPGSSRSGTHPGARVVGPAVDARRARALRRERGSAPGSR